jgi:hypothetical protein
MSTSLTDVTTLDDLAGERQLSNKITGWIELSGLDRSAKMPSFATGLSRRDVLAAAAVGAGVVASPSVAAEAAAASSFGAPLVELHVPAHR